MAPRRAVTWAPPHITGTPGQIALDTIDTARAGMTCPAKRTDTPTRSGLARCASSPRNHAPCEDVANERAADSTFYWFEVNFAGQDPGKSGVVGSSPNMIR